MVFEVEGEGVTYLFGIYHYNFAIECGCGAKGKSSYRNASVDLIEHTKKFRGWCGGILGKAHTYLIDEENLRGFLDKNHIKADGQEPLVIICGGCNREFSLTRESFLGLRSEARAV